MVLKYPKQFTDAEWKKAEKAIKVDATGVGKTLRDLEKAAKGLDQGCAAMLAGKADAARVRPLLAAHAAASKRAYDAVHTTWGKTANGTPAYKYLADMRHKLDRYATEVKDLDLKSHSIKDAIARVNSRIEG